MSVAVVSSRPLVRAGIVQLLASDPGQVLVDDVAAHDGHLAHERVVVFDLAAVATDLQDLRHLVRSGVAVIGVEPMGRPDLTEEALAAGVADVVTTEVTAEELVATVRRVHGGFRADLRTRQDATAAELSGRTGLTAREAEVLRLIVEGMSNHEIAATLFVSINTVKTYIRSLYRRIGVRRRSDAVLWAVQRGVSSHGRRR